MKPLKATFAILALVGALILAGLLMLIEPEEERG